MRVKKRILLSMFVFSTCLLLIYLCPFPALFPQANDIVLGLFCSGFLVFLASVIEYFDERRRAMEAFYREACRVMKLMKGYGYYHCLAPIERQRDSLDRITGHGIDDLDLVYSNLDFLFGNCSIRQSAYRDVYRPLCDRYSVIDECYRRLQSSNQVDVQRNVFEKLNRLLYDIGDDSDSGRVVDQRGKWAEINSALDSFFDKIYFVQRVTEESINKDRK